MVESPVQIAQRGADCSAVCSAAQLGAGPRKALPASGSYHTIYMYLAAWVGVHIHTCDMEEGKQASAGGSRSVSIDAFVMLMLID
jgi:hypothetical protein